MEILSWPQLVRHAGTRSAAERWVTEGLWWRVVRGAYARVEVPDDLSTRATALRLVLPADAVPSHRTALWLLGLDVLGDELQVTVPRGRHLRPRPGLRVFSAVLPDDELVEVGGHVIVSAPRAFFDVARRESLVEAVVVGDAILRSGAADADALAAVLEPAVGLRGVRAARAALPYLNGRSESPMESRFRMRLVLGGVPEPDVQYDVYDAHGHAGRVDLHIKGVVLEYDGRAARLDKQVFVQERRRQTRLAETGLELRRFTAADYYVRPAAAVCAEVQRAVELAARRHRAALRQGPDTLRPPRLRPLPTVADVRTAAA